MRNKQTIKENKMKIEKEYKENGIKITRYAPVKKRNTYIKGKPRKPVYGWKPPK